MRRRFGIPHGMALVTLSALWMVRCGGAGGEGGAGDDGAASGAGGDEYAEAVPDMDVLGLTFGEAGESTQALGLGEDVSAVEGPTFRSQILAFRDAINNLLRETHERIAQMVEATEPSEFRARNLTCKRWTLPVAALRWQLTSCVKDRGTRRFAFVLRAGRDEANLLPVFAGEGVAHMRYHGKRRGRGVVGYDFDNLGTVTGQNVAGKLGIGYRAVGRVRQLNIGLKGVRGPNAQEPVSALYRYTHVVGVGGILRYGTVDDFLRPAAEAGRLERGEDGKDEFVRATVAWARLGAARAFVAVCGDTVQDVLNRRCFQVRQCWQADGQIAFDEATNQGTWEQCPAIELAPNDLPPPEEAEVQAPSEEGAVEVPDESSNESFEMPGVEEPPADAAEAEE